MYDVMLLDDMKIIDDEFSSTKNRYRAKRRKDNVKKAVRKANISKRIYHIDWYDNLHQYSKNKVHCSCNLCRFRSKFNPNQITVQDMKIVDKMDDQFNEFINDND